MTWDVFSPARICPPRVRSELVGRERVDSLLLQSLGRCKLLLLCAPAGYGKTVALVQMLRKLPAGMAVAWVSASEDDDLQRVLACLLAALDPFDLPWRVSPQALPAMASGEGGVRTVANEVLGALHAAEAPQGLIVVDDAHRIKDARVFQFFDALLAQLPPRWTLAMTCREEPPLALARPRISGEVLELGQAQLRFEDDEAKALAQMLALAPEQADPWIHRAQGWPAGLVAGLMSQAADTGGRSRATAQRRMFEFLAEEVLAGLPQPLQLFLLRCSVLSELTVPRCEHVSDDVHAAHWLEEIERRELFATVLATEGLTLRLHDLFRDFLQERLQQELPSELPQLLTRAAEHETDIVVRVRLLLRAGDIDAAVHRMMDAALPMIEAGAGDQLLRLIEQFPQAVREESPDLAFVRGLYAELRFAFNTARISMRHAMQGFEASGRWQLALKARALGIVALVNSAHTTEARVLAEEAPLVEMDADTALVWTIGALTLSAPTGHHRDLPMHLQRMCDILVSSPATHQWLGVAHMHYVHVGRWGMRRPTNRLAEILTRLGSDKAPLLRGRALALRAWLALWTADLTLARELADEAEAESRWLGGAAAILIPLQLLRAFDCRLCGDAAGALRILSDLRDTAMRSSERRSGPFYANMLGTFGAFDGDWQAVRENLALIANAEASWDWPYVRVSKCALRAVLARHEGSLDEALQLYRSIGPGVLGISLWNLHSSTCVAWALAELQAGDAARAWQALSPALAMAVESDEVLGLLLCGPTALQELAHAPWPGDVAAVELAMLKRCARQARELGGTAPAAAPAATVTGAPVLSERELEVLRLVADGQSNKLIARALGLSPHTIKRHIARILDKTGQGSRGQAAAWLHALQTADG